jgi:hypothetical protein
MRKEMLENFWYWIEERQSIYQKRARGLPPPWTKDPILQEYKFTNVFRQLDRVSVVLHDDVLSEIPDTKLDRIFFAVFLFRMFNWPPTYYALRLAGLAARWDEKRAIALLTKRKKTEKIFTGAYIISNGGSTEPKVDMMCKAITTTWGERKRLAKNIERTKSLELSAEILYGLPQVGKFIAYELVSDLRWTKLLNKARDIDTWANVGPGADRGLRWLLYGSAKGEPKVGQRAGQAVMVDLLTRARTEVSFGKSLELREIEHSLCEFDKYMRVKTGVGRPRSKFRHLEEDIS